MSQKPPILSLIAMLHYLCTLKLYGWFHGLSPVITVKTVDVKSNAKQHFRTQVSITNNFFPNRGNKINGFYHILATNWLPNGG